MTNFDFNCYETDKTDKTIEVSNFDFLKEIFGSNLEAGRPLLVSFKGNPAVVAKHNWYGQPWSNDSNSTLPSDANNYFSLSRFMPNKEGEYRRKKKQFKSLHAIMLDDVGTKILLERLVLSPSWLLETSPGNYQAGYILDDPIRCAKKSDQLMDAIIKAGLCDPGANGPTSRLARLPVAINGKSDPVFQCRLEVWDPGITYSLEGLIAGFKLKLEEKKTKRPNYDSRELNEDDSEEVWCPRPEENAVIVTLKERSLYKRPLGENRHDITCPWVVEHTNSLDGGTAYFEPDDNYPTGGFKCQHGHCSNRNIRDLLNFLNVDIKSARMKPTIRVIKGEIDRIVEMAERELSKKEQYYQRYGLIVFVYTDPCTAETLIQPITQPALVRALSCIATWEQFDKRSNRWVRIDPPPRHTSILFDSFNYRHLPVINGIARQPYLRHDGSLMKHAGYDITTCMFGVFDGKKFSIPDKPTREEAILALNTLSGLLDEFCFATQVDKSAALSAMLTAAVRPGLANAPMFHVCAHSVGSGKSYLCALITAFATPQKGTPTTFPAEDEECRKLLLAELLRSPAVIEFDNLTSDILPHKTLCTVLTSEYISGRILGLSKTATVNTRTLFLSSGNNVLPIKDMARRCITVNLNPEVDVPAARTFVRPNLISEILEERERYASAAITIILAWVAADRPVTICKSLSGFSDWSDLCRQPLLWLGLPDPAMSIFETIEGDPDRELLTRLLNSWQVVFGNAPTMVREAVQKSRIELDDNKELKEILHDIADERGEINRHRLGRWIKRHEGQIIDGRRFLRCGGNNSAEKWRVCSVSSVLSSSFPAGGRNVMKEEYRRASSGE